MEVGSLIAIASVLVALKLVVLYGIAIRIYLSKKFWQILFWQLLRQTAKLPNLIPGQGFWLYSIADKLQNVMCTVQSICIPALYRNSTDIGGVAGGGLRGLEHPPLTCTQGLC